MLVFEAAVAYIDQMTFFHDHWPIFHEDNHLLVLYKPAGLIMQGGRVGKANLLDMAKLWLKRRYAKPGNVFLGLVHRLDGPVAGVIVLARTSKAASRLSAQFRDGRVQKRYLAVVSGRPPALTARLENWLKRHGRLSRISAAAGPGCQKAVLHYKLLDHRDRQSLLSIDLITGRRHQIRLQLSSIGCPILGDRHYGAAKALAHGRIALLSYSLALEHPVKGNRLQFESPLPRGWPWPHQENTLPTPPWTIEDYVHSGLDISINI